MSGGSDLGDFPRPSVAVDVAVLTVVEGCLGVVLWRRTDGTESGRWALPGSFVRERETLTAAVNRTLGDKCGLKGLAPTQLRVMDDPDRDERGWVLSVAHLDVVRADAVAGRAGGGEVTVAPVGDAGRDGVPTLDLPDGQKSLPFDHDRVVSLAVSAIRERYADRPDPSNLLGPVFTVLQLRLLHQAVAGRELQRDTFRRTMIPHLERLDAVEEGVVGRPARLYRRRG